MEILRTVREMQERAEQVRLAGKKIAVVPTMGALHEGHMSLLSLARANSDFVILTIFVNPTQFGPQEDFEQYPRDFKRDEHLAQDADADVLFYPDVEEIYPPPFLTYVVTGEVAEVFEGEIRPTHFSGVTTIVAKLFHLTKPHVAVFGQKDAQQLFIIRKMVQDLNFDIELLAGPIIREGDGLAKSSRNAYLGETERKNAPALYQSLKAAADLIKKGERDLQVVRDAITAILTAGSPAQIDYVAFVDPSNFKNVDKLEGKEVLVLLAVRFGSTRLIDNMIVPLG